MSKKKNIHAKFCKKERKKVFIKNIKKKFHERWKI